MKKTIFALLLSIFIIPNVNAETSYNIINYTTDNNLFNQDIYCLDTNCNSSKTDFLNKISELYNKHKENYPYYFVAITPNNNNQLFFGIWFFKNNFTYLSNVTLNSISFSDFTNCLGFIFTSNEILENINTSRDFNILINGKYELYDTNINFKLEGANFEIKNFYENSSIFLNNGDTLPTLSKMLNYDSWNEYTSNEFYTEVNLNNYEYVILKLKDYTKKEAFETNLKVKGMIGITPVYEYGTVEKNEITDRCNLSYEDYTDYRLYILKNDLVNNAVYYVKACEENSSLKFDSSVFDITYVTADNVDDPVITVGGQEYHTIPFNQLTNSANKNEEENFIPGESGSSLSDVINNITEYITSFWSSLTTFMSLVVKFFNTLPIEIRAISITTFTTACTLGLLKILKS